MHESYIITALYLTKWRPNRLAIMPEFMSNKFALSAMMQYTTEQSQCRFSFMGGFGRNRLSRRGNFHSNRWTALLLNLWTPGEGD